MVEGRKGGEEGSQGGRERSKKGRRGKEKEGEEKPDHLRNVFDTLCSDVLYDTKIFSRTPEPFGSCAQDYARIGSCSSYG